MYYFVSVNYGTSHIISDWICSIKNQCNKDKVIIIIDNYKNSEERKKVLQLSKELNFHLIESENRGYGNGLNKGIQYIKNNFGNKGIIFAGNLDLEYKNIPELPIDNDYVFVPKVMEGTRNRNPFLTRLQHKITPLYKIAGITQSPYLYYVVIAINKAVGLFPSKIWAVHGSLFCFSNSLIDNDILFNNESFLYGEELEFASYMEFKKAKFFDTDIVVNHDSHICTKDINASTKTFLQFWWPSFKNWGDRWN